MPSYAYKAISETGKPIAGVVEAASLEAASGKVAALGHIPTKVVEQRGERRSSGRGKLRWRSVTSQELILFTKQFRTMFKAGVSMVYLLQTLEHQTESPRLRQVAAAMGEDVRQGATLYEAFRRHPRVFSSLYCSMVRAGEQSGQLPVVMARLVRLLEHEHRIRSDIKSALQYPMIVVFALLVAFVVLETFVIPKFADIFRNAGITLPMPTRVAMGLYQFLAGYWWLLLGVAVLAILGLVRYLRTDQGRHARDRLALLIPLVGPVFVRSAMSRFASIFAVLSRSGVSLLDALEILSGTIGNTAIAREFDRVKAQVQEGQGVSGPLRSARYFPPMVINMVAIGEETGNLDEMLQEVSAHYDDEVAYAVARMSGALGPLLIVGLAAVVGFFALAIFLPMWDLTKMVQ